MQVDQSLSHSVRNPIRQRLALGFAKLAIGRLLGFASKALSHGSACSLFHSTRNLVSRRSPLGLARLAYGCLLGLAAGCGENEPQSTDVELAPGPRAADVLSNGGAGFAEADGPRTFQFPADHAAHPAYRSEWWYLTYALKDAAGAEFGVQFTLFRRALFPGGDSADPWRNGQAYLAHFAVTDVQAARHRETERLARGHPALAGVREEGRQVVAWLEDWRLLMAADSAWTLNAAADGMAAALQMRPSKPVVLQGEAGLSAKGPGQASYYYSVPRLQTTGTVQIDGRHHKVSGLGWLDREWSTSALSPGQIGWAWFALMLNDGADLMAFQLRRQDSTRDPHDHGAWIDPKGNKRTLTPADFRLTPTHHWRDDQGAQWPTTWRLDLGEQRFTITASLNDQRMDTLFTYWEGLVKVTDAAGQDVGRGYMELTGY